MAATTTTTPTAVGVTVTLIVLVFGLPVCCEGFDFTLEPLDVGSSEFSDSLAPCGILRCTETLAHIPAAGQSKSARKLIGVTVYRKRLSGDDVLARRWEPLASVTSQQPRLDPVSDGARIFGQLTDLQANLTVNLVNAQEDCHSSQFSCVATFVNSEGQNSVKKSFVGKDVKLLSGVSPQSAPFSGYGSIDKQQHSSVGTLAQLMNSFHMKLDWIESRLEDSLKDLENRLEDKVGDMRATVTHIIGGVDSRIGNTLENLGSKLDRLENRLEDKLGHLGTRLTETSLETKKIAQVTESTSSQLSNKINSMERELLDNFSQHAGNKARASEQSKYTLELKEHISEQLANVISGIQLLGNNLTCLNQPRVPASTSTAESTELSNLVSSVESLTNLTQTLMTSVKTFRNSYAGGSLVPVEDFSDPLGTGRKEWRLVFRGTAYNNVPVYPAYIHGTGIPREVEHGCKQFNQSLPCVNHFRNKKALADWASIDEVLFAVYKDGQIVKRVVFNGKGSTYTSWFTAGRVILSSWDDLTTQPHNIFSIEGEKHPDTPRRFFMSLDYAKGCAGFRGWFYASDYVPGRCPAETTLALPMFHYAVGSTFAVWASTNVARADAIGVFVKYE